MQLLLSVATFSGMGIAVTTHGQSLRHLGAVMGLNLRNILQLMLILSVKPGMMRSDALLRLLIYTLLDIYTYYV